MTKKSKKNVEKSVELLPAPAHPKKPKTKYRKGKFPHTVELIKTGALFVRKVVQVEVLEMHLKTGEKIICRKQKQVWRVCDPPTKERSAEVLFAASLFNISRKSMDKITENLTVPSFSSFILICQSLSFICPYKRLT